MLGETTWGTWIAYGVIALFLLLLMAIVLRQAVLMSLLFLSPAATVWRRIREVFRRGDAPFTQRPRGEA